MANKIPEKTERNQRIVEYYDNKKMSFKKIGKIFNLTRARTHAIYWRQKEKQGIV